MAARRIGDYIVRYGERADISQVIMINTVSLPEHYSEYFYEELLQQSPRTFLVAEKGNIIVGYIMCRMEHGFSNLKRFGFGRKGHIVSVAVLQEHRGQGLGRALIEGAIEGMKNKGCSEAFLEVRISNTQATSLYERLGFSKCSTIPGYYKDGEAAFVMALSLEQASAS